MILTDRFVFIHMPKTGGTFVRRALLRAHRVPSLGGRPPPARLAARRGLAFGPQHATSREVPASHRHLPLVSVIRNPLDRYVSQYEYAWWKGRVVPGIGPDEIRMRYPSFPDLTFAEFLELAVEHFGHMKTSPLPPADRPGYHTEQFVRFYARDPERTWANLDDAYARSGSLRADLREVRFLRGSRLTSDLCAYLAEAGYDEAAVARAGATRRTYPTRVRLNPRDVLLRWKPRRSAVRWEDYYTPDLEAYVRHRERFLFELFSEF